MKTFEEKFTAWVDGNLKGEELAAFEVELAQVKDAELDKLAAHQLGDLFREHGRAPELQNADFFNHQLMQQIEADQPKPVAKPERARFSWSLPRIALAGAFSLALAVGLYFSLIPQQPLHNPQVAQVPSMQILNTHGGTPEITASAFHTDKDNVTVLWIDGLKYVPDKKAEKKTEPEKPAAK
jgi:hypothetical protein